MRGPSTIQHRSFLYQKKLSLELEEVRNPTPGIGSAGPGRVGAGVEECRTTGKASVSVRGLFLSSCAPLAGSGASSRCPNISKKCDSKNFSTSCYQNDVRACVCVRDALVLSFPCFCLSCPSCPVRSLCPVCLCLCLSSCLCPRLRSGACG